MLDLITQAAKNFLNNDLELKTQTYKDSVDNGYISLISTTAITDKYEVYIVSSLDFLKLVSNVMLFDDNPDDATMEDLNKELNNIIVGSAKVLAEQQEREIFDISTPKSFGNKTFDMEYDSFSSLSEDDKAMTIAIKKIS